MRILLFFILSSAAWAQDFSDLKVERVAAGYRYAEGPVWSLDGYLLFSDTVTNRLFKFVPGRATSLYRDQLVGSSGNTFDLQGRLYTCEFRDRRVTRTDRKGKVDVLAERYDGKRLNAPNDIVVRKDGNVYFTDPAFGDQQDHRELDFYGVYHLTSKNDLKVVAKPRGRPNGITVSPNGRVLYVTNSDEHNVRAYDLDRAGSASKERVLISGIEGVPGGVRVDEKGNLYVAARAVFVYSPEGKPLVTIEFSDGPTNCAFGDPDLQGLYVTTRVAVFRVRLKVKGALQYTP